MIKIRHKENRGTTGTYWLDSHHSFSFGEYYDPQNMGFGPLRVINEDFVKPAAGFPMHGHKNMEIITYVLKGSLEHKDSLGNGSVIRPGDVQMMSAGKGILHSEYNPSPDEEVHLLQIWLMPSDVGGHPGYQQHHVDDAALRNTLKKIVAPAVEGDALGIKQDASLYATRLDDARDVSFETRKDRKYWIQVAQGNLNVGGHDLSAGDALSLENEQGTFIMKATGAAEALLFDLPV